MAAAPPLSRGGPRTWGFGAVLHSSPTIPEVVPLPKSYTEKARALILLAAFLSFLLSVGIYFLDDETRGIFVGLWVPSILALGALILPPREGPKQ